MEFGNNLYMHAKDLEVLNKKIKVSGFSGVDHNFEFYPVEFSDGLNLEKDILMLKLKCIDTGISKGILIITNDTEISNKIWMMAEESNIILLELIKK